MKSLKHELKYKIKITHSSNLKDVWRIVQDAWYTIPVEKCKILINSIQELISVVFKSKGLQINANK